MGDAGDSQPAPRGTQPPQSIASSPQFSPLLAAPVRAVPDPTVPSVGPPLSATVSDRCPQHALTGRPNPPDVVATSQQHTQHSTARSVGRTRSARARLLTGRSTADGSEHSRSKTPHQGREHSNDSWYWLNDAKDGWLAVQFVEQKGDVVTLKTAEDEHYEVPASPPLKAAMPSSLGGHSNMLHLGELHEGAILHNLRSRYTTDTVYTAISSIILSINPYKQLPCYGPGQIALYRKMLANDNADTVPAAAGNCNEVSKGNVAVPGQPLPPHVYALADQAYASLLRDQVNQAIIISGESGAGKTEATKLCLQYLAEISGQNADIAQQILEANPILEAFGNAKTVRNNNSSRFGKWCEIHFDSSTLRIRGASIISYLLEKSRVVNQAAGERNYHAFYFLCAGASPADRAALHLGADGASAYRLLNRGACLVVDGISDAAEYKDMVKALEILRFSATEITQVMQIVAAILHTGNIDFERVAAAASAGPADAERYAIANSASTLAFACELLALDSAQCARALTTKQLRIAGGEIITVFNSAQTCVDNRDALVKSLYEALFLRLLHSINTTLQKDSPQNPKCIGVLDIFGFENFEQTGNFFEQLCINYANEKLQSHFTQHVFALEQKEYAREGIDVSEVGFVDNSACLALIEERRVGIIDMIVEEIRLPKGSDMNLLQRMHDAYAPTSAPHAPADKTTYAKPSHAYYVRPKGAQTKEMIFSIRHFAGDVSYQVAGFLEKNKDSLSDLLRETIESSASEHVSKLLSFKHQQSSGSAVSPAEGAKKMTMRFSVDQGHPGQNHGTPTAGSTLAMPSPSPSPPGASPRSGASNGDRPSAALNTTPAGFSLASPSTTLAKKRFSDAGSLTSPLSPVAMGAGSPSASASGLTLGAQFRSQLSDLLATLNCCRSNFIRCLKPNASKIPDHFDSVFVLAQLQYLGIKEVIAIRQLGFPVRIKQEEFMKRYGLLTNNGSVASSASAASPSSIADVKSRVTQIFHTLKLSDADWRFGLTQVFFRSVCHTALEAARDAKFVSVVTKLQALYRCKMLRTKYKRMQKASRRLQAAVIDAQDQSQRGSTVVAADSASNGGGAPSDAAWSLEIDAALAEATDLSLPLWRLVEARKIRARAVEVAQARRALAGAIQVKDVPLLRGAIQRALDVKLDPTTPELTGAQMLLERLVKYLAALTAALEARSIEALQSVLAEAASLQLDSSAERDAHALLRQLKEERACEERLDALVAARGPLPALTEAITAAELLGLSASNGSGTPSSIHRSLKSASLVRAVALASLLAREESLLKSLADAIKARDLSSLDASLSEITSDASLQAIHGHPSVTTAHALKAELKAAALASECAAHVRAALASRNAPHIESSLVSLRELGAEALASLGAGVAAALEAEAQTVLASIRARGAALVQLQAALEERSLPALQSALAFASAQVADARCSELAEFSAATKMVAAFTTVLAALESSTASRDLVALQSALESAAKLGLDAATSTSVAAAFAMRAKLQRIGEVKGVLRSAITANDESMLTMALQRASEAELEAREPEVAQAQAALDSLRAKAARAEEEARAAVAAMEAEKARAAAEAAEAAHAAAAHAAAQALAASAKASGPAPAPHAAASSASSSAAASSAAVSPASSNPSSARSSVSGRPPHPKVFQPDLYRAGHFALSLFPLLRTPDDFARNKLFGKKELASSMLSWSKDPLPRSLLKLSTDDASSNACNLFRAVQGFMGDRAYSFPDGLGCEVLAAGVSTPELRDEIFVQLAKQLQHNAAVESVRKGWQLMGLACESFAPSESLRPFLYHFLLSFQDQPSYHARNYVAFCLRILQQQSPGCSVATAPVIAHVAAFRERVMQSAEVSIFFPDGSSFTTLLDPSVTTRQVMDQLLERAGLNAANHLPSMALFHQNSATEEPVALLPSACPLDFPAAKIGLDGHGDGGVGCRFLLSKRIWSAEMSQEPWSPAFAALLKHGASASSMSLVADMSLPDQLLLSILFYQHVLDLLRFEHYALSRADLVHVVSVYQKVVELQVLPLVAESHGTAVAEMAALQPAVAASWTDDERAGFAREVAQAKSRLASAASYSPFALLDSAWVSRPNFGYASFPVQNPELKSLPELVTVGVSIQGLFLIDTQTKAVLKQFKFAHVTGWAANTIKFSLRVLIAKAKTQQLNFATPIGKRITATIQEFVDFIVARNTKLKAAAEGSHAAH